ncbi:thioesterase family protein [Saccharopolyspora rhizosphaerae]|uniref:Thioesterase family protein n=1 Tax=Saccharopolyspora rhizosphaerae TaxID=2492662 RepID=A0A426K1B6_9PSEU|nr:thioesterase family protein [Saccharopolyspora rhizosphaerae]RRO19222.1 thioesterase family protein [Saccharopolyspora rhizosphaerae]
MVATVGDGYFARVGDGRYKPTAHVGGAWRADEQHFSPLGGLIVHAIEQARTAEGRPDLVMSRISFDILGQIALEEFDIHVETVRPGRTIELTEATVVIGGRAVVRARAWLLAEVDTEVVAGGEPASLTPPNELEPWPMGSVWSGGFIESLHTRVVGEPRPGRTTAWVTTGHELVVGEEVSPLASFVALIDTANGIAVRQEPTKWMFPNVDLTLHLHRQPSGEWTGLDTKVTFGARGQGLTSTDLHDVDGPVGHAEQILTVRPL